MAADLVGEVRRLALAYTNRYATDVPAEELVSEALFALVYAAGRYDESRGIPFPAYAKLVIHHVMKFAVERWRRWNRTGQIPIGESDRQLDAEDCRPRPDLCGKLTAAELLERARDVLPARWFDALKLRHGEEWTLQEIGERLDVSPQRVAQLLEKGMELAKRAIGWEGVQG
jgi:RNA polymerase sigma factor (sigma-70 family)